MASRIGYIDIMKGIGITLVILGHTSSIPYLAPFIYSVHMPLFFLIAGYFFHDEKSEFSLVIKKTARRYILPYLVTCLIILCLFPATGFHYDYSFTQTLKACIWGKSTINVPYVNAIFSDFPAIGAIWFLLALSFAEIFLYLSFKFHKWQLLFIIIILIVGIFSFRYIYLPFSIQNGMVACIYLYLGHVYREREKWISLHLNNFLAKFILLIIWAISVCFGGVNIAICQIKGYIILGLLGSCGGVLLIKVLSQFLSKHSNKVVFLMTKLGQISLFVLCIHVIDLDCLNLIARFSKILSINDIGWIYHITQTATIFIVYSIYIVSLYLIFIRIGLLKKVFNLK